MRLITICKIPAKSFRRLSGRNGGKTVRLIIFTKSDMTEPLGKSLAQGEILTNSLNFPDENVFYVMLASLKQSYRDSQQPMLSGQQLG
jgi:hypothetical protein